MTATDSNTSENSYFNHIDRAPYELGHLLQRLPEHFSSRSEPTPTADMQLIATAAAQHAENANDTLLRGLDALGRLIYTAADNDQGGISSQDMRSIGVLISHLAVEAEFLQETQSNLEFTLQELAKKSVAAA